VIDQIGGGADRLDRWAMPVEHHPMLDELSPPADEPATAVEFIGFESPPAAESVSVKGNGAVPALPVSVKPKPRRATKARKRTHTVRVVFDEDEFRKLNLQAGAVEMALSEFVRRRALHDPRTRNRQSALPADDLFVGDKVRDKVVEVTVVRLTAPLSPDLDRRITAYFSSEGGFGRGALREPPPLELLPARPNLFARLGQLMTELVAVRWPGHRATPPAHT
jgi:hypothetical protein